MSIKEQPLKENNLPSPKTIKKWILESIKTTPKMRKVVISDCVKKLKLSPEQMKDNSSSSYLTRCKSYIGQILSQLLNNNDLTIDTDKKIQLAKVIKDIYKEDEIETDILAMLADNKELKKKDIFAQIEQKYGSATLKNSKMQTHRWAGNALAKLVKAEIIVNAKGNFSLNTDTSYPNTEIGNCLKDASKEQDVFPYFIKAINIKGGEFFEAYSVRLLELYFGKFYTIKNSKLTGGPFDNGIDGIIEIEDSLGYREKIHIQCKVRVSSQITLKEVREFFGAVCSEKGTRGLFITNSTFHHAATKFFAKNNNLVAVNKDKLFELAKSCAHGLIPKQNTWKIDEALFL